MSPTDSPAKDAAHGFGKAGERGAAGGSGACPPATAPLAAAPLAASPLAVRSLAPAVSAARDGEHGSACDPEAAADGGEQPPSNAAPATATTAPPPSSEPAPTRILVLVLLSSSKATQIRAPRLAERARKELPKAARRFDSVYVLKEQRGRPSKEVEAEDASDAVPSGVVELAVLVAESEMPWAAQGDAARTALTGLAERRPQLRLAPLVRLLPDDWLGTNRDAQESGELWQRAALGDARGRGKKTPRDEAEPPAKRLAVDPGPSAHGSAAEGESARLDDPAVRARWACQQPLKPAPKHNVRIAAVLEELASVYRKAGTNKSDPFRALQFGKASKLFLTWRCEIRTVDDLKQMEAEVNARVLALRQQGNRDLAVGSLVLGPKVVAVVSDMILAGPGNERAACERLQNLLAEERVRTILMFTRLWGVGLSKANELYGAGLRTYAQLRLPENEHHLDRRAKVGLQFVDEFEQRIPREEVARIAARVRQALERLLAQTYPDDEPGEASRRILACDPVGSYRRGRANSGDTDVLICLNDRTKREGMLLKLVSLLTEEGFITHSLSGPSDDRVGSAHEARVKASFMGVCLPATDGVHRRIDIKLYPREMLPFALLYFTGSDYFNRSMRHYAKRKGYLLSDNGLSVRPGASRVRMPPAIFESEQQIFEFLGLEWREPAQRDLAVTPLLDPSGDPAAHADFELGAKEETHAGAEVDSDDEHIVTRILELKERREANGLAPAGPIDDCMAA
jgi:DNA polymerase/3'-5' exonuclease PolX